MYEQSHTTERCPNPRCSREYERTVYLPNCGPVAWHVDGERYGDCPECGTWLEDTFQDVKRYREARAALLAAEAKADAAFLRWFTKRQRGEATNGAQATRLANLANYLSADLAGAEFPLYSAEIDPRDVDRRDGVHAGETRVTS